MSTYLIAFLVFLLAVAAMAVGVLISGKRLTRTCSSGGDECQCAKARAEALAAGKVPPALGSCRGSERPPQARACACETEADEPEA